MRAGSRRSTGPPPASGGRSDVRLAEIDGPCRAARCRSRAWTCALGWPARPRPPAMRSSDGFRAECGVHDPTRGGRGHPSTRESLVVVVRTALAPLPSGARCTAVLPTVSLSASISTGPPLPQRRRRAARGSSAGDGAVGPRAEHATHLLVLRPAGAESAVALPFAARRRAPSRIDRRRHCPPRRLRRSAGPSADSRPRRRPVPGGRRRTDPARRGVGGQWAAVPGRRCAVARPGVRRRVGVRGAPASGGGRGVLFAARDGEAAPSPRPGCPSGGWPASGLGRPRPSSMNSPPG